MRLGRWVIMRMHPDEKTLRTVTELTPAMSALIARMARSAAKDAIQNVMESKGLAFSGCAYVPRAEAVAALDMYKEACITLMSKDKTPQEHDEAVAAIQQARDFLQYHVLNGPCDETLGVHR